MIVKTDAIVLKGMRYRETSKIVTFYTSRYGKVSAIAKGARDTKSKFGAALEPMTGVSLVLYKKDQRELQLVSQCDIRKAYKKTHSEMDRMEGALSVLELLHQVTHDEEENSALFALVEETLDAMESSTGRLRNIRYGFELRLCAVFGFAPVFDRCVNCGRPGNHAEGVRTTVFRLDKGGLLCAECIAAIPPASVRRIEEVSDSSSAAGSLLRLQGATGMILARLMTARLESLGGLDYPKPVGNELSATLRSYLRYHFENMRPLKTVRVFEQLS